MAYIEATTSVSSSFPGTEKRNDDDDDTWDGYENCILLQRRLNNCSSKKNRSSSLFKASFFIRNITLGAAWTRTIIVAIGCLPLFIIFSSLVNLTPRHPRPSRRLQFLTIFYLFVFIFIFSSSVVDGYRPDDDSSISTTSLKAGTFFNTTSITTIHFVEKPTNVAATDPMWIHRLIFASLNGLLFLLGLANVLVLFIVSRYRRMRTVTNILIFNLCLADLIYISFLPVVIMFQLLRDWRFGIIACKLFYITESTAKYASVYFVGVLSLDRYFALCHPQVCKRYRRPSLALLASAIGWCVTAALMTPIYLYSTVVGQDGERFCTVAWPNGGNSLLGPVDDFFGYVPFDPNDPMENGANDSYLLDDPKNFDADEYYNETYPNQTGNYYSPFSISTAPSTQFYFITLTFVFCFGLPALVILFFYFKVLDQLFQASNRAERLKKRKEKTYRKVTRMVLAVVSFYLICWLPYWIQFLVVTFVVFSLNNALKIFFNTIHLLPYLNCAMNPILYSLMTDNFRRILAELFPCLSIFTRCRKRPKTKHLSQSQQAMALLERNESRYRGNQNLKVKGNYDATVIDGQTVNSTRFTSLSLSISPSIRMVSDFSINLLSVRRQSGDEIGSPSATSISTL